MMFANMTDCRTSILWIVWFVISIKGLHAEIITRKYNSTEDCVFPSVDIGAITIATFVFAYGQLRCAAECLANIQCTGYLLETGDCKILYDYIFMLLCISNLA